MRTLSLVFTAGLLLGHASINWASPPSGHSPAAAAGRSNVQRALDSRAGLLQRANISAHGQAGAATSGSVPSGVASQVYDSRTTSAAGSPQTGQTTAAAKANAKADVSAAFSANATDSAHVGGHAQAEGQANVSRSVARPQSGTGRLPQEVARRRAGEFRARQSFEGRNNASVQLGTAQRRETAGRPDGLGRESRFEQRGNAAALPAAAAARLDAVGRTEVAGRTEASGRGDVAGRADMVARGQNRLALTHAERLLATRLAQIDAMRDRAVDTGNDRLLEQADHLEQLARWQHAGRLAGRMGRTEYEVQTDAESEGTTLIRHPFRGLRDQEATPAQPAATPSADVERESVE